MVKIVVMIIGTFFLYAGLLDLAFRGLNTAGLFLFGLGAFVIWLGARRRDRWQFPLGITWLVFALIMCGAVPSLRRSGIERGDQVMIQGSSDILVAGVSLGVFGVILILFHLWARRLGMSENPEISDAEIACFEKNYTKMSHEQFENLQIDDLTEEARIAHTKVLERRKGTAPDMQH